MQSERRYLGHSSTLGSLVHTDFKKKKIVWFSLFWESFGREYF